MKNKTAKRLINFVIVFYLVAGVKAQVIERPDTVTVRSGNLLLKGLLWRPAGKRVFPSVIFCHGSYESNNLRYDAVQQTSVLGPLFARNGFIFLGLFRQGTGLSKDHGESTANLMSRALKEKDKRNAIGFKCINCKQMTCRTCLQDSNF